MAKKGEAPLAEIKENKTTFNLTFGKMLDITANLRILKDFQDAEYPILRKFQKNIRILEPELVDFQDASDLLQIKNQQLNEEAADPAKVSELPKKRKEFEEEVKKFNKDTKEVALYTIKESDFPSKREKYPKKLMQTNSGPNEVDTFTAFQDLIGTVIEEDI